MFFCREISAVIWWSTDVRNVIKHVESRYFRIQSLNFLRLYNIYNIYNI